MTTSVNASLSSIHVLVEYKHELKQRQKLLGIIQASPDEYENLNQTNERLRTAAGRVLNATQNKEPRTASSAVRESWQDVAERDNLIFKQAKRKIKEIDTFLSQLHKEELEIPLCIVPDELEEELNRIQEKNKFLIGELVELKKSNQILMQGLQTQKNILTQAVQEFQEIQQTKRDPKTGFWKRRHSDLPIRRYRPYF